MAVPPKESGQADLSIPTIAVGVQVHLLVLDCAPQTFHQDVVVAAFPPRPAELDPICLQPGHVLARGELSALIRVEDLGLTITCQHHLQGIQTKLRVKAVRELPAEHIPREKVHKRHQVEKTFLQRDVSDVSGPHLVECRDLFEIHQAGESLCRIPWHCGAGLPVDRS